MGNPVIQVTCKFFSKSRNRMPRFADTLGMTLPRQILPGATYLITRRCTQRRFLLKPSRRMNAIFWYCLAVAAERYGIIIHAVCVMSNHYHIVATDPHGRIPAFMGFLNKFVAKCVNAKLGRWENVWATEQPSLVTLTDAGDVLDKIVYTLTNPVAALLVKEGRKWPGARSAPDMYTRGEYTFERPEVFFRTNGKMPPRATLRIERPAVRLHESDEEFSDHLRQLLRQREQEIQAKARREGKRFMHPRELARQRHSDRPGSRAKRRGLSPRVAARNKWRRIEALQRLKEFVVAYREAWKQWRTGVTDVLFPAGTYAVVQHAGARSAPT